MELDSTGLPEPVSYYIVYAASLIHGAADAALTLILHNLGREAKILERQVFECWVRAQYYANDPDEARDALYSTAFAEMRLMDDLGYDTSSDRYRNMAKLCKRIARVRPDATRYREPTIRKIVGAKPENPELLRFYSLHYRIASQMVHGTFAGASGVMAEDQISFDSRQRNPNYTIEAITAYILAFLELADARLALGLGERIRALKLAFENSTRKLRTDP